MYASISYILVQLYSMCRSSASSQPEEEVIIYNEVASSGNDDSIQSSMGEHALKHGWSYTLVVTGVVLMAALLAYLLFSWLWKRCCRGRIFPSSFHHHQLPMTYNQGPHAALQLQLLQQAAALPAPSLAPALQHQLAGHTARRGSVASVMGGLPTISQDPGPAVMQPGIDSAWATVLNQPGSGSAFHRA